MVFRCKQVNPSNAESAYDTKIFEKTSKPCHVCNYAIALAEYSQMSTNMPGF